jgi:hypothetical protein
MINRDNQSHDFPSRAVQKLEEFISGAVGFFEVFNGLLPVTLEDFREYSRDKIAIAVMDYLVSRYKIA